MRLALAVEYDGGAFCGWQTQPNGMAVQDTLERALSVIAGHTVHTVAAGRTDTGVHALHQVVHFDTEAERPLDAWVRGVNAHLPPAVRVIWSGVVDDHFHARFDATARHYQYLLYNNPAAPAILAGKAGWFHTPLNELWMQQAADTLLGEHDFSAFRAAECQAKTPVRTLFRADVVRQGAYILFSFSGNAFLHHQVRNMVGALVYIGKGKYPASYMTELLAMQDRTKAPPTFMADGLYLVGVDYDVHWGIPSLPRTLQVLP